MEYLKFLLTQDHMRLEKSNATPPTVFIRSEPNFMIDKAVIRELNL